MPRALLETSLRGHLTRAELDRSLALLVPALELAQDKVLVIDCREMTGYDLDARHAFVEWNGKWRIKIERVAIVTTNRVYHVVITAMSLASGQAMRGFADHDAALAWAHDLPNPKAASR